MGMNEGWRSVFYLIFAFSLACWLGTFFIPETYGPVLLTQKAQRIRKYTGQTIEEIASPVERTGKTVAQTIKGSIIRPLEFLAFEPIVLVVSIYTALCVENPFYVSVLLFVVLTCEPHASSQQCFALRSSFSQRLRCFVFALCCIRKFCKLQSRPWVIFAAHLWFPRFSSVLLFISHTPFKAFTISTPAKAVSRSWASVSVL